MKRAHGEGGIDERGENSFRLRYYVDGKRHTETFRGTKKDAQALLAKRRTDVAESKFVEPNKKTVAEFVKARIDQWEAAAHISARTAARYRELLANQITPHIGAKILQKLRPTDIEEWHTTLRNNGRAGGRVALLHERLVRLIECCPRHSVMRSRMN
jgi:integrase